MPLHGHLAVAIGMLVKHYTLPNTTRAGQVGLTAEIQSNIGRTLRKVWECGQQTSGSVREVRVVHAQGSVEVPRCAALLEKGAWVNTYTHMTTPTIYHLENSLKRAVTPTI